MPPGVMNPVVPEAGDPFVIPMTRERPAGSHLWSPRTGPENVDDGGLVTRPPHADRAFAVHIGPIAPEGGHFDTHGVAPALTDTYPAGHLSIDSELPAFVQEALGVGDTVAARTSSGWTRGPYLDRILRFIVHRTRHDVVHDEDIPPRVLRSHEPE